MNSLNIAPQAGSGFAFTDFLPIILIVIVAIIALLFAKKFFD